MRALWLLFLCSAKVWTATIVCLGDSLTAGYGLSEAEAWPAVLEQDLRRDHPTVQVLNAGRSGDTSAGGRRRLDWSLKANPRIVVVALGANDGLRGLSLSELDANLRWMIQRITAAKARPVIAGMRLPTNFGEDYRRDFAAIFPRLADTEHATLIPFLLDGVAMQPELNLPDGIHPNPAGHRIVAATVAAVLRPLLVDNPLTGQPTP